MRSGFLSAVLLLAFSATSASAGEEPYGEGFDGWRFTQEDNPGGKINCRAYLGIHVMAMRTDGNVYVSTSSDGLPKGKDEEANIRIGRTDELVQTTSGGRGGRLVIGGTVDRAMLEQIVASRGYTWTTGLAGRTYRGTVTFNASTVRAYRMLKACVTANGGKV